MIIKVISLNIWCGGRFLPKVVEFLKAQDADVVALQELYDSHDPALGTEYHSMDLLKEQLDYPHVDFAEDYQEHLGDSKISHGIAVFSKFPINGRSANYLTKPLAEPIEFREIPEHWPLHPAVLQHLELVTPAGDLNVVNLHGVWDMDGDSYSERRQYTSQVMMAETKDKPNVVLMGDTNAKASNQAMRNLEQHLKPVFGDELVTTFNMRHKTNPGYATAAVDLMYVSPEIEVVSRDCPDVDISDHRPLIVELEIS